MKAFHHHLLTHLVWLLYHQGSLCAMRILNASIVRSVPECWALCRWIMHGWAVSNLCDRQKYFRLGQKIFWDKKIFGWVSAVLGCVTGVAAPVAGGWMESCVNLCSNQITGSLAGGSNHGHPHLISMSLGAVFIFSRISEVAETEIDWHQIL